MECTNFRMEYKKTVFNLRMTLICPFSMYDSPVENDQITKFELMISGATTEYSTVRDNYFL